MRLRLRLRSRSRSDLGRRFRRRPPPRALRESQASRAKAPGSSPWSVGAAINPPAQARRESLRRSASSYPIPTGNGDPACCGWAPRHACSGAWRSYTAAADAVPGRSRLRLVKSVIAAAFGEAGSRVLSGRASGVEGGRRREARWTVDGAGDANTSARFGCGLALYICAHIVTPTPTPTAWACRRGGGCVRALRPSGAPFLGDARLLLSQNTFPAALREPVDLPSASSGRLPFPPATNCCDKRRERPIRSVPGRNAPEASYITASSKPAPADPAPTSRSFFQHTQPTEP